jgi:hypothetical protein
LRRRVCSLRPGTTDAFQNEANSTNKKGPDSFVMD